jgi:UDP-3-O-[3-hydroxymyristoyl] glucosamine N-acyltransferase
MAAHRLGDLATLCGGVVVGDAQVTIDRVASVEEADEHALTFAVDDRWLERALRSRAGAVLVAARPSASATVQRPLIVVDNVRAALAAVLASFSKALPSGEHTDPTAIIGAGVQRGADVWIGPGVIVGAGAHLGDRCLLLGGCYVGAAAVIGARSLLHPRATVLDECIIGDDCVLQSGCIIGGDGFGFVRVGAEQIKIPQIGNVVLGDRVEIGANTTIDRAVTGSTVIGAGTKIDNQVQIAHNVQIGEDSTICAQTGIAGSTKVGARVTMGGQVGMIGHIEIGAGTLIAAGSKVIGSLPPNSFVSGDYAMPHRENMQQKVLLRKLPKLFEQVRTLTDALDELRSRKKTSRSR